MTAGGDAVSPQMQAALALLRSRRGAPVDPDPVVALAATRAGAEALAAAFPVPDDVVVEQDELGGVAVERLVPPGADPAHTLLYLHGGAYVAWSPRTHRELAARLARAAGCVAVVPDYRLAPEHPYPAAVEDVVAVHRSLSGPTVLAGDSAGGGLALALLQRLRAAAAPQPVAVALLSPWTDLTLSDPEVHALAVDDVMLDLERTGRSARQYAGTTELTHPELSPVGMDLQGLPPLHLEVGTAELLLPDSRRLAARARDAGVDVTLHEQAGMPHVWPFLASTPEAHSSTDRVGAFLRGHLQRL
ncbi:MAG: 6-hexanolactone hydrolase [Frankiales bacterium]|nr:6-hexanolactone hydrolase [Frankiales bacterium]